MSAAALVILGKAPELGRTKTRLAADIGPEAALELARAFIQDVWAHAASFAEATGGTATLLLSGDPSGLPALVAPRIAPQCTGDLGARIEHAARTGLQGHGRVLVLGTDSPGLPRGLLIRALEALEHREAVLAPALDGGFVLIGLRRCPAGLLADLPWSEEDTCARTLARLRARGLRTAILPPWFDVDHASELQRLWTLLLYDAVRAPATGAALDALGLPPAPPCPPPRPVPEDPPELSVIIPVLDEVKRLPRRLQELMALPGVDEIVVADGGSRDGTLALLEAWPGLRVVHAPPGRARQQNAGARAARGRTLLFLHADVGLPEDAPTQIRRALSRAGVVGGAFVTHTHPDGGPHSLGPLLRLADLRSRYTRYPYGDQAIFVRRADFFEAGGFPDIPLMEDLELSRRLRRRGRLARCWSPVRVSGRRFETRPLYYTALVNIFPALYKLGVSPDRLAALYRHTR